MAIVQACIWQENNWWVAHGLDILIATQGGSLSEAMENFSEALSLHLEAPVNSINLSFSPPADSRTVEIDLPGRVRENAPVAPTAAAVPGLPDDLIIVGDVDTPVAAQVKEAKATEEFVPPADEATAMSFREVRMRLQTAGFKGISQRPKHAKFIKQESTGVKTAVLPHYTDLAAAVVRSILCQAQISWDDFTKLEGSF